MAPSGTAANEAAIGKALGARKAKTRKGRKILQDREPKVTENGKTALILKGNKASLEVTNMLRDLHRLRTPLSMLYSRTHDFHPFEDAGKVEVLCKKFDHGLFAFGSSSKKRPCRLILGRLFDSHVLDMQELKVSDYKQINSFPSFKKDAVLGAKPLLLFQGSGFETDERLKRVKSLFLDFFSGARPNKVVLEGLEHVIVISAMDGAGAAPPPSAAAASLAAGGAAAGLAAAAAAAVAAAAAPSLDKDPKVTFRRFAIMRSKSGSRFPRIELQEVGPSFEMGLDRVREPEKEMWKKAIKVAKQAKPKKVKNIKTEVTGKTKGQIHLGKQDFDQIHTIHHGKAKAKKLRADLDIQARKKRKMSGAAAEG